MQLNWSFLQEIALVTVVCSALFWGTAGYALNAAARSPRALGAVIGAVFTVAGVIGLAIAAGLKNARRHRKAAIETEEGTAPDPLMPAQKRDTRASERPRWPSNIQRISAGGAALVAVGLLLMSVLVPLFVVRIGILPPWEFLTLGTGFDFVAYLSCAIVTLGAVFIIRWPTAWAAILIAWVADWTLFLVLVLILLRQNLAAVLSNLQLSLGDLFNGFGLGQGVGIIGLGSSSAKATANGPSFDLRGLDLTSTLHNAGVDLGPGFYLMIGFAIAANVTVFMTVGRLGRAVGVLKPQATADLVVSEDRAPSARAEEASPGIGALVPSQAAQGDQPRSFARWLRRTRPH